MYPDSRYPQPQRHLCVGPSNPSPIHKLPIELLSFIFDLSTHGYPPSSVEEDEEDYGYRQPTFNSESVTAPLILASVCRHWRSVAHNTQSLWSSLCISPELLEYHLDGSSTLNLTNLASYLYFSRNHPLDILIDARDQNWDFSEPDVTSYTGSTDYTPPFSARHMEHIIRLLLPHIRRWKSLTILTDTWAPMHTALSTIGPALTQYGAPLLESLTLMRCNDFVSFSPEFQPRNLKEPVLLRLDSSSNPNLLPRLKHLSLRGVHLDWTSLAEVLEASPKGLTTLDLASLCANVRPSAENLQRIIRSSASSLQSISVIGSGPDVDTLSHYEAIPLPNLHKLIIGYRDALDGLTMLQLLKAPQTKVLTLEDASFPGDPEVIDASSLLACVSTSSFSSSTQGSFPSVERLSLSGVKTSSCRHLKEFFTSLPALTRLSMSSMSVHSVQTLLPSSPSSSSPATVTSPCPRLSSLHLKGFRERLQLQDLALLVTRLPSTRQASGACALKDISITASVATAGQCHYWMKKFAVPSPGIKVTIISDEDEDSDLDVLSSDDDSFDDDSDEDIDVSMTQLAQSEKDAFKIGGIFNDPAFDSYYGLPLAIR